MPQITPETGVQIAVLVLVVPVIWWAATTLSSMRNDLREVKAAIGNSMTMERAELVATRLAMHNPGLRVPDPRAPHKVIKVSIDGGDDAHGMPCRVT